MWPFSKNTTTTPAAERSSEFSDNTSEFEALLLKIRAVCGIDLEVKKDTIRPKLIKFCQQHNLISFAQLTGKIDLQHSIRQELFDLITVCETYFYRELKQLQEVIYQLRRNPHMRRVLVAPCSSGEEVYSILMLAKESVLSGIEITGIDINSSIIAKAKAGVYSKRSLYTLDPTLTRRYFDEIDDEYHIKKQLLGRANFKVVNVFDREFQTLGSFDVILSRNMMIYFNEEYKYKLVDNFYKQLNPGGMFFAGHADLVPQHDGFEKVYSATCNYYQKK